MLIDGGANDTMQNLALFDFDGTITHADTFTPFIYYAVKPWRMAIGKLLLGPLIAAYKLGILPASAMRALSVRVGFCGRGEAEIREAGRRYANSELPSVVRKQALERIAWHQAEGDVVVVVSASLDVYLRDWCDGLGLKLICTQLEARSGVLSGRYLGGDCTGHEKARRVRDQFDLGRFPIIYAYGDTTEDSEMLALAHRKYFRWKELG
jgi:phosphatidylglycerophosphatase C